MPRFLSHPVVTPVAVFPPAHSVASSMGEGSGMFQSLNRRPATRRCTRTRARLALEAPCHRRRQLLAVASEASSTSGCSDSRSCSAGQYFSWNAGLSAGFAGFMLAYALIGVA
ncbi:hypothetical protein PINS_up020297, partial [Pythium insidiosum]